jgi:N-glycosylase/DNA lyase
MQYTAEAGGVAFACDPFDIAKTFGCGQAFRFSLDESGAAEGVAFGRRLRIEARGGGAFLPGASEEGFLSLFAPYLSLDTDMRELERRLATDDAMKEAIRLGSGIRILRQEPWEAACSFVLSQNSNIPRIRKMVESLAQACGEWRGDCYAFPSPEAILSAGAQKLSSLGLGYRDRYVLSLAEAAASGALDFERLRGVGAPEARRALMQVKGVGEKVADCILLFGLGHLGAWPQDVWIKRALLLHYGISEKDGPAFAREKWGDLAGLAQQYLYFAERDRAGKGLAGAGA